MRTGIDSVRQMAEAMGVTVTFQTPSIALGTAEPPGGHGAGLRRLCQPRSPPRDAPPGPHRDSRGGYDRYVLTVLTPPFPAVLTEGHADMMIRMLESVVDSGTARSLRYQFTCTTTWRARPALLKTSRRLVHRLQPCWW